MPIAPAETRFIPLTQVDLAPDARPHDPTALEQLTNDMNQQGQLQEIIVEAKGDRFVVIAGVGRTLAARKLAWEQIRASVRTGVSEFERARITFAENEDREEVDAFYQAYQMTKMLEAKEVSQDDLAVELGISKGMVNAYVAIHKLPAEIQKVKRLTVGQLIQIARLNQPEMQIRLAGECAENDLSVRQLKALVDRKLAKQEAGKAKSPKPEDPLRGRLRFMQTSSVFKVGGGWLFQFAERTPRDSHKKKFGWNFWVAADFEKPTASLRKWFLDMAEALDTAEAGSRMVKGPEPLLKTAPPLRTYAPNEKVNLDELWEAKTRKDLDLKQKENLEARVPKEGEEAEVRKLAEEGPGPVYAWIFGAGGFFATRAATVTWQQMGTTAQKGCTEIITALRAFEKAALETEKIYKNWGKPALKTADEKN